VKLYCAFLEAHALHQIRGSATDSGVDIIVDKLLFVLSWDGLTEGQPVLKSRSSASAAISQRGDLTKKEQTQPMRN